MKRTNEIGICMNTPRAVKQNFTTKKEYRPLSGHLTYLEYCRQHRDVYLFGSTPSQL